MLSADRITAFFTSPLSAFLRKPFWGVLFNCGPVGREGAVNGFHVEALLANRWGRNRILGDRGVGRPLQTTAPQTPLPAVNYKPNSKVRFVPLVDIRVRIEKDRLASGV